ncbi:MAG: MnhB domain-containing protein [Clostridiaceae bacterium]
MNSEKNTLINILALLFIIILAFSLYKVVISDGQGINILDETKIENRVSTRYLNKNVNDLNSTYEYGGQAEDTAANIVTSIVADYRLFDTSLEVVILFVTILSFSLVIPKEKSSIKPASSIIKYWSPVLMVFMIMVGFYMFAFGHLSPGGGFPAGAILSTAVLLGFLSKNNVFKRIWFKRVEALAGISIFLIGILGFILKGSFFENFIIGGEIGSLFSAGLIPILYFLVAFKVASEISGIFFDFYGEEEGYELN